MGRINVLLTVAWMGEILKAVMAGEDERRGRHYGGGVAVMALMGLKTSAASARYVSRSGRE